MTPKPADDRPTSGPFGGDAAMRLLDTLPAGVLVVQPGTTVVTYANATVCRVLNTSVRDVVGTRLDGLFLPASSAMIIALLAAGSDAATDPPAGAMAELIVGEGRTLTVLLMANHSVDTDGQSVRLTVHAATANRVREQGLIDARDDAVSARVVAEAAQSVAEDAQSVAEDAQSTAVRALTRSSQALTRSQSALGESEDARKSAEAERTQVQILATTLQRCLLPPMLTAPDATEVAAYYHHASEEEVGGDFYDVFPLDSQTWGFFLGDVSGKGAGAAAVTSLTRYTLRAAAVFDRDPVAVLHNLNTVLLHEFHGEDPRFCTVVYGTLTPGDGVVSVDMASGGHPPALHLRADGTAGYVDTVGGQLVGALTKPHFRAARVTLSAGDVLLLYTDGLTEARVGPGALRYDDTGALENFAVACAPTTAAGVVDDLVGVLNGFGDGLEDDVALLAIGAPPAGG